MTDHKDEKDVAGFLFCSTLLEESVFSLYRNLSEKVQNSTVKSLLTYIAYDSLKHSAVLRGISESISKSKPKTGDCEKKLKDVWEEIVSFAQEISKKQKITDGELPSIVRRLVGFESSVSEEYFILVELKTLEFMTKQISEVYKVDLESLKSVFELVIKDEEKHRDILTMIEELLPEEESVKDNTPVVRYQHPNAW